MDEYARDSSCMLDFFCEGRFICLDFRANQDLDLLKLEYVITELKDAIFFLDFFDLLK